MDGGNASVPEARDSVPIRRALLSVTDKTGIVEFAQGLWKAGAELLSTGGTAQLISNSGIPVIQVSDWTGSPEILGGRVKTLHPKVFAGILYRRGNSSDEASLSSLGATGIDLLAVNLYAFESARAQGKPSSEIVENIDIGGPSLIRAAAKNFESVAVVTSPARYASVLDEINSHGGVSRATRASLAAEAFSLTARYDAHITSFYRELSGDSTLFPPSLTLPFDKVADLRYGENPHQGAAVYSSQKLGIAGIPQLQGKEISFNNLLDADAAFSLIQEFPEGHSCAIVKHNNPCGCAVAPTQLESFSSALACDSQSAFGGIVAFTRSLEAATAEELSKMFLEVVIAPGFEPAALETLSKKKKNVRVLDSSLIMGAKKSLEFRSILGGLLVQQADSFLFDPAALKSVTKRAPTEQEMADLLFAWKVCKHVKSNAVIFAKANRTIGIGAGQMSRVDSCKIAVEKAKVAGLDVAGSVLASDAFFPFRDTVDFAAKAGITAVIQPGGSIRDSESIDAANESGMAMLFTGTRHFRH